MWDWFVFYMCGLQLNCLIILLYEFLIIADLFKQANKPDFHAFFRNCISYLFNYDDLCIYFFVPKFKFMKFMYSTFHPHLSRVHYERQGSNPGKPPWIFFRVSFCNCISWSLTAMIIFSSI